MRRGGGSTDQLHGMDANPSPPRVQPLPPTHTSPHSSSPGSSHKTPSFAFPPPTLYSSPPMPVHSIGPNSPYTGRGSPTPPHMRRQHAHSHSYSSLTNLSTSPEYSGSFPFPATSPSTGLTSARQQGRGGAVGGIAPSAQYHRGGLQQPVHANAPVLSPSPHQQQQQQQQLHQLHQLQQQHYQQQYNGSNFSSLPTAPSSSSSSSSRMHRPTASSPPLSLQTITSPTAATISALLRDPLTPTSTHSSTDLSPPDDEADDSLRISRSTTPAATTAAASAAAGGVVSEVDALKRTVDNLHRVNLSYQLKEQALEKQVQDMQRQIDQQIVDAYRQQQQQTEGASASSAPDSHSSLMPSVSSPVSSSPHISSSTATATPAIPTLPPSLSSSLSTHLSSLLSHLAPTRQSEQRRISTLSYLKALVRKSLGAQCYPLASHALKTYLDGEEMTVSAFFSRAHESSWLQRVVNALCQEAYAGGGVAGGDEKDTAVPTVSAQYLIQSVTVLFATSKQHAVVRCTIGGVGVSMYGNNVIALASLALFEHVDTLVGQSHLFKRSILLFKAWAMARNIYGGTNQDEVTSGLFLRTLMLFTFNRFHSEIRTPLDALCQLLRFCYGFDWDSHALTVYGAVLLSSLDAPRLLPATDTEHAWPADVQPLISPAIVQQYQAQSKRVAASGGLLGADSGSSPSGQAGKAGMPRVNSSAFLEIPGEGGAVSRSNSETNLAGLAGVRSASSSSLSSLAAGYTPAAAAAAVVASRPPPSLSSGTARDADVRGASYASTSSSPTSSASFRGSKSYTSLTSLDYTPDHSPVPNSSSSTTSSASGSFFNTSSSQSRLPSIPSPSAAASMAFPPTVSADAMLTAMGATDQYESSARAAASYEQEDDELAAGDEDEEQSLSSDEEDEDNATGTAASASPSASSAINPLDLYLPPAVSASSPSSAASAGVAPLAYPVCSLNVLDAMERGKNLGIGVAYKWQYKVRTVLRDGWSALCAAMERDTEREKSEGGVRSIEAGAGVEGVEGNAVLRELFDAATLSEYRERLYREQKARAAAIVSPSNAVTPAEGEQSHLREKGELVFIDSISPTSAASPPAVRSPSTSSLAATSGSSLFSHPIGTTSSTASPHQPVVSPASQSSSTTATKSTLNPYSSEFIPSSASATTAAVTVQLSTSPTKSSTVPLSTSASSSASSHLSFPSSTTDDPLNRSQSPPLPVTAHPTFDPLDGNLPKILTHLSHARQFEVPSLSLPDLLSLLSSILASSGPVPVGRLGSLLHERTNNHSLPALLKEEYGGLKRLLERYPDSFVVGKDHPYNPHVSVKGGVVAAGGGVGGGSGGGKGGVGGGKKKVQRRRTRVRRLNHRGSSNNLAALSAGGAVGSTSSGLTPSLSAISLAAAARPPLTPVVAIDCEMIGVGSGGLHSILARVSVVSSTYDVLYDSYVAPPPAEPITDYRTHVSGITPSLLHSAPSFATVQREVASIIKGRVLIGHGLVGDLQALCLNHPRGLQRDTAHFRLLCPVRPIALKRLLEERLGIVVQEGVHDSVEDARGAMMLYESVASEWEESMAGMAGVATEQTTTVYQIM